MGALRPSRAGWVRGSSDVKQRRRYYDQKFDKLQRNMDESVSGTVLTRLAPLLHMTKGGLLLLLAFVTTIIQMVLNFVFYKPDMETTGASTRT